MCENKYEHVQEKETPAHPFYFHGFILWFVLYVFHWWCNVKSFAKVI